MPNRRKVLKSLAVLPAVVTAGSSNKSEPRRLVVPEAALRRIEEIFEEGGVITSISIGYSLPSKPGWVSTGTSFLHGSKECDWKIV